MFARNDKSTASSDVTRLTLFAGRSGWYLRALGLNPLVRVVDRIEALAVLGIVITALVAIPVAVSAGALVRGWGMQTAEQEAHNRHPVQATVVAGVGLPTDFETPAYVEAQWHEGTRTRTESVAGTATVRVGDHMIIWLDDSGKVVAAPLTPADAELNSVAIAVTLWIGMVLCSAFCTQLIRRGLDRARDRAWEREIRLFAHNDDGWANRQG
jgi:hypothetical protein